MSSYIQPIGIFWIFFYGVAGLMYWLQLQSAFLKDVPTNPDPPYYDPRRKRRLQPFSWSRVQLAWWTLIVVSSFASISMAYHEAPEVDESTLILLGMSCLTVAAARTIDISDKGALERRGQNFWLDILSDKTGVSMPRLQNVLFNVAFGLWYIYEVNHRLIFQPGGGENAVMPHIAADNLILLGISSATYAILKVAENISIKIK